MSDGVQFMAIHIETTKLSVTVNVIHVCKHPMVKWHEMTNEQHRRLDAQTRDT